MSDSTDKIEPTKKEQTWLRPSENKNIFNPGLYLVPTPIGNLSDITLRALDVLCIADIILCEDTRVTKKLLNYYGINQKNLKTYNDHSDESVRSDAMESIQAGKIIALVSDAGTPLVSDPGYKLVRDVVDADLPVIPLPGANAVLPALQLSAMPTDQFAFLGFLPNKDKAREDILNQWAQADLTIIFYETAPRLLKSLKAMEAIMGQRQIAVLREMSKLYEEARRGKAADLVEYYEEQGAPKGEIVIVIEPDNTIMDEQSVIEKLKAALQDHRTKEAARIVAEQTGWSKTQLYDMALALSKEE